VSALPGQPEQLVDRDGRATPLWYEFFRDQDAWKPFTSTLGAQSGALTTATATGRYKKIGAKTVIFSLAISITTNGTAAGYLTASLPFTGGVAAQVVSGRENSSTGKMLQGVLNAGASTLFILNYDNTYPGGNGYSLVLTGIIETK
jgi:hypothetical protein